MSESFAALLDESLSTLEMQPGSIVTGVVLDVDKDWVTVHVGLKSEGVISLDEFRNNDGTVQIESGDEVQVALEAVEDGYGETRISREKARKIGTWKKLEDALETGEFVEGKVLTRVKGGFSVEVDVVKAFLPGSLVDIRPVKEAPELENTVQEFKVIKLDYKRNNVVLSRKAVLEKINSAEKVELLKNLDEGQIVKGIVKNLTDYGAFVDLGGLDGLLHITDISWSRVTNPSEVLSLGQEIDVKILSFDKEKLRVSLGLKQIQNDPWETIEGKYSVGGIYEATVSNLTDYGCFVEIEDGVEGLVHVSEMDWTNKNIHPSKVVNLGDVVEVMVLEIDEERRRISLGLKQCIPNPWEEFAKSYNKGDKVSGKIKSITDFGIFIGLDGGIDGLVHLSDIAWNKTGEEAVRDFKKGDEIHAVVLQVDPERERISLGVKQIDEDPFNQYLADFTKGTIVTGTITAADAKGVTVHLADEVEGYIRVGDLSRDRVEDASEVVTVGDSIEAKYTGVDRKNRVVTLSVKAKDQAEEKDALEKVNQTNDDQGSTNAMAEAFKAAKGE